MIEEHPLVKESDAAPIKCRCVRCLHEWWTRTPNKPKRCPSCKQHRWEVPARTPKEKPVTQDTRKKYPIHDLEVGESVLLPFFRADNGEADTRKNASMNCSVDNYGRRSGKVFERKVEGAAGIRVTRTK